MVGFENPPHEKLEVHGIHIEGDQDQQG
jgi:hypothetical protein